MNAEHSQYQVRSVFILLFSAIAVLAISETPPVATFLARTAGTPIAAKRSIVVMALLVATVGWVFLLNEVKCSQSWRRWVAVGAAILITISLPMYLLYAAVPLKWLIKSKLLEATVTAWSLRHDELADAGLIGAFVGIGKSRVAFVAAAVLMAVLWGTTH